MKEYIKQIVDIMKENNLIGIQIDLVNNTVSEQYNTDPEETIKESVIDINQLVENIRQENLNVQQEDAEIVNNNIPEGYYDLDQVEMLTGFKRNGISALMRYHNIRVNKINNRKSYYNKEDIDSFVAKRNIVGSKLLTSEVAKDIGITQSAIHMCIRRMKIEPTRVGIKAYITKEEAEKIKEAYKYNSTVADAYMSIDEIQQLLGITSDGAARFVKRNHVTNTGRVTRNRTSVVLYDRYEVMTLINQRNKQASLEKYEISKDQLMTLFNCSSTNIAQLARRHNLRVFYRDNLKHHGKHVAIYDLRDMLKKCISKNHVSLLQREIERREAQ